MHGTKLSGYRIGIKFDNSIVVAEENNYTSKIVSAYISYDLDTWSKFPVTTFTVKYKVKEKWVYNDYGIAFDGKGEWSFCNDFARNVVIFGVDNSLSSHADNHRNNF